MRLSAIKWPRLSHTVTLTKMLSSRAFVIAAARIEFASAKVKLPDITHDLCLSMGDHRVHVRRNVGRGVQGYRGPNRVNFLLRYPVAAQKVTGGRVTRLQRHPTATTTRVSVSRS